MPKEIKSNIDFKRKLVELAKKQNLPLEVDGVEVFSAGGSFRTNVFFAVGNKIHRTHIQGSLRYLHDSDLKQVVKFYDDLIKNNK